MKKSTIKPYVFLLITIVFLIAVAFITPAHTVTPALQNIVKDGVNNVDGLVGVYSVVASSNGAHVYVAGNNDDAVTVFSRDKTSGALIYVESIFDNETLGLDGACSVIVSPDDAYVYVAGNNDDAVTVFSRDKTSGALAYVQSIFDNETLGLNGAKSMTMSPDGAFVYVGGLGDDAITVFSRDKTSGFLTYAERHFDNISYGLDEPYSITMSPDGVHVYVGGLGDDAITVFSRDKTSGALAYVKSYFDNATFGLDGASSIAMSPDGIHLYVTGYFDDAVTVFSRDETSGALAYVQSIFDNDTLGLDGAKQVIVSPDGAHVYVTGTENDAVTVFSLSKTSGELKHIESIFDNKTIGLNGAGSVTVSPDGAHVYIGGYYDDAVTVFSRDATNGVLTFTEIVKE